MDEVSRWAELLLAGPRGREVCSLASGVDLSNYPTRRGRKVSVVQADALKAARRLAAVSVDHLRITNKTATKWVSRAVGSATYWQEQDDDELLLADPRVARALRPVAEALAASEATSWWDDPLRVNDQFFISWLFRTKQTRADPPRLTGAAKHRSRWRVDAEQEELEASRRPPPPPGTSYSGSWWSTPTFSGLVATTPRLPNGTPADLVFIEDEEGITRARVARLAPNRNIRIYEIREPVDLVELVSRYPLPAHHARRHDWGPTTGCSGPWLIPNWDAIGNDYDAVHLTVLGYLATAGRALPVGNHYTMLAGWNPSKTWWLNDVLTQTETPSTWEQHSSTRWRPSINQA